MQWTLRKTHNVVFCSNTIAVASYTNHLKNRYPIWIGTIETIIFFAPKKVNKSTSGKKFCSLGLINHQEGFYTNKCSTMHCLQSSYSEPVKEFTVFFFFQIFPQYLVAVSTCVSQKWSRYIVSLFETRAPLHVLLLLLLLLLKSSLSPLLYLGTVIFKKQFTKPLFELWSNLCKPSVKQLVFKRVAGPLSHCYNYLDHLPKQLKIAAIIIAECNLPTNLI